MAACAVAAHSPAAATAAPGITEFSTGISPGGDPKGIAAGPDGALWFTEPSADRVARITTDGVVTEFTAGITADSYPNGIAAGPDGNLWFTESVTNRVARITQAGVVTEFSTGISPGSYPSAVTAGPDGNLWFTESVGHRIARITPAGVVTEFSAGITPGTYLRAITAGPDGNLWFTGYGDKVGRITPAGEVTEFSAGITVGSYPSGIAAGPDGNLWFTETRGDRVVRITPGGEVKEFSVGIRPGSYPSAIATGADRNLWFTETVGNRVGRITPAGAVTEFTAGITADSSPEGITAGPDGHIWFTEPSGGRVARIADLPPTAVTRGASGISQSQATVIGSVEANREPTRVSFEYGPSTAYGFSTAARAAGASSTPAEVSETLSELAAGMLYHYRLVATNASGESYGADATFTTSVSVPASPSPPTTRSRVPKLSELSLHPRSFVAARSPGAVRGTGATVRYRVTRPVSIAFSVQRRLSGRRKRGQCVAATPRARQTRPCTRYVSLPGRFKRKGRLGRNRFHFSGRMSRRRLAPGRYRMVATAISVARAPLPTVASFRIIR